MIDKLEAALTRHKSRLANTHTGAWTAQQSHLWFQDDVEAVLHEANVQARAIACAADPAFAVAMGGRAA